MVGLEGAPLNVGVYETEHLASGGVGFVGQLMTCVRNKLEFRIGEFLLHEAQIEAPVDGCVACALDDQHLPFRWLAVRHVLIPCVHGPAERKGQMPLLQGIVFDRLKEHFIRRVPSEPAWN